MKDKYSFSKIEDSFDQLHSSSILLKIDLRSGYLLNKEDVQEN